MAVQSGSEGLFASLKHLAATFVAMGRTRLELLGNEIAIEKQRLLRLLLLSQALLFCLGLGVILLVALTVLLFWDQRLIVVGALVIIFLGVAGFVYAAIGRLLSPPQSVFAGSLAELEEDLRQLKKAASSHEQKPG